MKKFSYHNKTKFKVAVVGATGLVGQEMIRMLQHRKFPVEQLIPLASARSVGQSVIFRKKKIAIQELTEKSFEGVDIGLFSAGGNVSKQYAPIAVSSGCVVIDNTSAFRMDPEVPLVVPEVNASDIKKHMGLIANPNCSTIQMVQVLYPIHKRYKIKRIVVSTYQSVSGGGRKSIDTLLNQLVHKLSKRKWVTDSDKPIFAFNVIPHIDVFLEDGYTKEEWKMIHETKKIFHDSKIKVTATCVRVPVIRGHSESINIQTSKSFDIKSIKKIVSTTPNVILQDDPSKSIYPMPIHCEGKIETFVGRLRMDPTEKNCMHLWVVSDNLLKGAAWNAVQIAEALI